MNSLVTKVLVRGDVIKKNIDNRILKNLRDFAIGEARSVLSGEKFMHYFSTNHPHTGDQLISAE
ncbi:MAG: hypothetical protein ABI876_18935 [Bacteroidota bacterium]